MKNSKVLCSDLSFLFVGNGSHYQNEATGNQRFNETEELAIEASY
ncbi:hypothetical protein VCRA2119O147_340040 [Vibrio crassostreae]|nr:MULTISPECIES: hypothetical protein [Vibrio]CAK2342578.1 hypothetical protein VCRA2119O147_340040 [Vibrio crassostreae]CAK2813149.1 hypothetical protein VCRA2110O183_310041 [Vibrio crassostreae]CAK2897146.1 hypothetical protein VCRA2121O264_310041 [Vibrio crassostreae]CAK3564382.1 hypothetical protein VCRA2121O262_320026 [Vibrio crassostreae]